MILFKWACTKSLNEIIDLKKRQKNAGIQGIWMIRIFK